MNIITEDLQPLLNKAYFFLKFRPRTEKELRDHLYKKIQKLHWSRDDVGKVIETLKEQDLINDGNFVKWFVEQRNILKPKSEFALRQELIRHGVDKSIVDDYFSNNRPDEEELALKSLIQRWRTYRYLDKRKRFEKAAAFLMRRGFNFEIIKKTIGKLEDEI